MNGFPESETARAVRERRLPGARRGGEVPDRLRPAAAAHDVRGQGAHGAQRGADALAAQPHPPRRRTDTFVLDFRNELEDIQAVLRARTTSARRRSRPTRTSLYDTHRALWEFGVLREDEVEAGVQRLLSVTETSGHGAVYAALDPALARFGRARRGGAGRVPRRADPLRHHVRVRLADRPVRRPASSSATTSTPGRSSPSLPSQAAERLDLGSEVELTHLRIAQTFEGSGSLEEGGGEVVAIFSGRGTQHEPEPEQLSQIVDVINERFGLELGDTDQLLFDQFEETWAADEELAARARDQRLRELPARLRPDVRRHGRQAHGRERGHLQADPRRARLPADDARLLRRAALRAATRRARSARAV